MKKVFLFLASFLIFCSINAQNKNDIEKYTSKKLKYGFVENKGQILNQNLKVNSEVLYLLSMGNGMNVQLKKNSFSYDTYKSEINENEKDPLAVNIQPNKETKKDVTYYFHRVDVELIGANPNPEVKAEEPNASYLNYYSAGTSDGKAINVRNYKKITYKDIYPGIDMVFTTQPDKEKLVEYTFVVHPGADAKLIQLHYNGAIETQLTDNKINIDVVNGRFNENIPASWVKETNTKLSVAYNNIGKDIYSFDIPLYSSEQTLIIDPNPNLDWATYFGGTGDEVGTGIACDNQGNVCITGYTNSAAAIATNGAGVYQTIFGGGNSDAFVAKFDNNGVIQWATYFGGSGDDQGTGIACDGSGNVCITGYTNSDSSIASATGAFQPAFGGGTNDAFVAKFNSSGAIQWSTYYGGTGDDRGTGITCDANGNVFVTGYTNSATAIGTPGSYKLSFSGGTYDAFIVKFNSSGARQWGTYYGGSGDDEANGIALDATGNIFITGITNTSSTDTIMFSHFAHDTVFGGGTYDAFIAKFVPSGIRQWGSYYGGSGDDIGTAVTCDIGGDVLITGYTNSTTNIASSGAYQSAFGGGTNDAYNDAYVAKFKTNGSLIWSTYYGGTLNDVANGIACDASGNYITITGYTNSTNAIATSSSYQISYGGGINFGDAFVVELDKNCVRQWGTYFGGGADEYGTGIVFDGGGNVFITGQTKSSTAIATDSAYQTTIGGGEDAFIAKFSTCNNPLDATTMYGQTHVCMPEDSSNYLVAPLTPPVPPSSPTSYVWTLPDGSIDTTTLNSIYLHFNQDTVGQILTLSVYGTNACGVGASTFSQIQLYPTPPAPVITISTIGDTLTSNVATGNQWYDSTATISGATNQVYVVTANGYYHDIVTVNGCSSPMSNIKQINNIVDTVHPGIQVNKDIKAIKVYPNPVSNQLIIETDGNTDKLYFEIFNSIGEIVYNGYLIDKAIVQTTNFAPGIYLLKLENGKTFDYKKIIKE